MSLTRKLLSTMGLNEDQVEQIIEAHTETVNAIKEERDNFKAEAEKLPGVQKELDKLKKAVENTEESPYKAQYEQAVEEKTKLEKEFNQYKETQAAKETKAKREAAARAYFKEKNITKDADLEIVMRGSRDEIGALDDEGKIKDAKALDALVDGIYSKFVVTEGTQGAKTSTPPANNGGESKPVSRAAQMAQQYRNEHYGTKED